MNEHNLLHTMHEPPEDGWLCIPEKNSSFATVDHVSKTVKTMIFRSGSIF